MKKPWEMTYTEWVDNGCPTENLKWAPIAIKQTPLFRIGREYEVKAIRDYLMLLPNNAWKKGVIGPNPETYLPHRYRDFGDSKWVIQTRSCIVHIEDAREAIILGRLLGYRDEDIAYYIVRNYVVAIQKQLKKESSTNGRDKSIPGVQI